MKLLHFKYKKPASSYSVLFCVTILIGVASGLGGMSLVILLHYIQHLAFGYSPDHIISHEDFLEGVRAASAGRRIVMLFLCGIIAGWGWWIIYRFGRPLVSIEAAIQSKKPSMPTLTTISHALLQIITIALGSPLGREVAPREIGALFANWLSARAGLSLKETQVMIACGAGAGLAAVYNVPLGGMVFILETLLNTFSWNVFIPAMATCAIAVVVSWVGLGNAPIYHIPDFTISYSLVMWSILTSPIFGAAAYWFASITASAHKVAKHNWQLPLFCFLNFILIGLLSVYFPALLGNGKSPAGLEFAGVASMQLTIMLLILRVAIVWSSLRAGAHGGLLMPSIANGALLGAFLGEIWRFFLPYTPLGAYAIVGATAFLAASRKMPLTAIVLLFEFTRVNLNFLIPMLFSVVGAIAVFKLCMNTFSQKVVTPSCADTKT